MNELGIDYAWARPSPAAIAGAGYTTVMRYLCIGDAIKELSAAEAASLHAQGLGIGLVWETTAARAGAGYAAGLSDAKTAKAHAAALGFPPPCPIFFAVDYDATVAAVVPYFNGVADSGLGHPVGVYGSFRIVEGILAAGLATYAWQATAWSYSGNRLQVSTKAHMLQTLDHTHPIGGASGWDENRILRPFPRWGLTTTPPEEIPVDQNTFNTLLANGLVSALRNAPSVRAEMNALVRNGVASVLNERTPAIVSAIAKAVPGTDPAVIEAAVAAALAGKYDVTLTPDGQ